MQDQGKIAIVKRLTLFLLAATLSSNATGQIAVVIPDDASREIKYSARELALYLNRITGSDHPVTTASSSDRSGNQIHVGLNPGIDNVPDMTKCAPDGYWLKSQRDGSLLIVGGSDVGTSHGVYGFLQDYCGVRFFLPGADGTHVPENKELSLPLLDSLNNPFFVSRHFFARNSYDHAWYKHNRMSWPRFYIHHGLGSYIRPSVYGESNPEYFPVKTPGGEREVPPSDRNVRWQPCMSNPGVVEVVAENVIEYFRENPEDVVISLGVNDMGGYCRCDECEKVNGKPGRNSRGMPDFARLAFTFYNKVAERVAAACPEKYIGIIAYANMRDFPEDMTLHPNIMVIRVNSFLPFFCDENRKDLPQSLEMFKSAKFFGLYSYFYGRGYLIPVFPMKILEEYVDAMAAAPNARLWASECVPQWPVDGIKYYILARKLWDPSLRYRDLLAEFTTTMFGEGSSDMLEFYDLCREIWESQKVRMPDKYHFWRYSPRQVALFDAATCGKLLALLKNARSMADSPKGQRLLDTKIQYYTFLESLAGLAALFAGPVPEKLDELSERTIALEKRRRETDMLYRAAQEHLPPGRPDRLFSVSRMLSPEAVALPLLLASKEANDMSGWKKFLAVAGDDPDIAWLGESAETILNAENLLPQPAFKDEEAKTGRDTGWRYVKWNATSGCKNFKTDIGGSVWGGLTGFQGIFSWAPFSGYQQKVALKKDRTYMLSFDYFVSNDASYGETFDTPTAVADVRILGGGGNNWRPLLSTTPKTGVCFFSVPTDGDYDAWLGMEGLGHVLYNNVTLRELPEQRETALDLYSAPDLPLLDILPEPLTVKLPDDYHRFLPKADYEVTRPIFLLLRRLGGAGLSATHMFFGHYDLKVRFRASGDYLVVRYTELEWGGRPGPWRDAFRGRLASEPADYEFVIRHTPNVATVRMRFSCPERFENQPGIELLELVPVPAEANR